jgi:hypothetical protein
VKSISAEAMAAIEAGEAIVTGAVEIYTPGSEPIDMPAPTDVVLSWQQNSEPPSFPGLYNSGRMGFGFLDENGDAVGTIVWADLTTSVGAWVSRSVDGTSPAEARTIRIYMYADQSNLTSAQCFDSIAIAVGGVTVTLINPGAEVGDMTGWDREIGGAGEPFFSVTTANGVAAAHSGSRFFASGNPFIAQATQDIPLSVFEPTDPVTPEAVVQVWGGYGPIEIETSPGVFTTYQGVGDRGMAQQTGGAVGGIAQGVELTLSRLEPELLGLLDANEIKGGAVILRRLIFASDGKTLLDYDIWERGRVDTVSTVETIGGQAAIKVAVESAARGLGRTGARMRSDSDQRLINPNDGYFRFCAYAGEKMLYWGGKKPSRIPGSTMVGQPGSGGV